MTFGSISLVIPLALAVAVRMVWWWQARDFILFKHQLLDAAVYDAWARSIVAGDWLSRAQGEFLLSPLYAYFLAAIYAVSGFSISAVMAVQAGLGILTVWGLYRLGRSLGGERIGALSAGLWALYGTSWVMEASLISASVIVWCNVWAMVGLVEWSENPPSRRQCASAGWRVWLSGAGLGCSILLRPNALLLVPLAGWWIWRESRELHESPLKPLLLLACGMGVILGTTTARNWVVTGRPSVLVESGGMNFYLGNRLGADGMYSTLAFDPGVPVAQAESFRKMAERESGRSLDRHEASRYWWIKTWREISADVPRWMKLLTKKALLAGNRVEVPMNVNVDFQRRHSIWLKVMGGIQAWMLLMLVPIGALAAWSSGGAGRHERSPRFAGEAGASPRGAGRLLVGYVGSYWAALTMIFVSGEYRFPMMAGACVLAAHGAGVLAGMPSRWGVVILMAGVSWLPLSGESRLWQAQEYVKMGTAYMAESRTEKGIEAYSEGLEFDPRNGLLHLNLGTALAHELRDYQGAVFQFGEALNCTLTMEEQGKSLMGMGLALVELKEYSRARKAFERVVSLNPGSAAGWQFLGNAQFLLKDFPAAKNSWTQSLKLSPHNPALKTNLEVLEKKTR